MIRNILSIAGKELQVLLKDRGALAVLFLLPLLLASLLGSIGAAVVGPSEGETGLVIPAYLVNQDSGQYGAQVTSVLEDVDVLEVSSLDTVEEANQRVADGERLAAIVIPADFSVNVDAYQPSTVQVIVDPVQAEFGGIVTGIMNDVLTPVVLQGEIRYGIRSVMESSDAYQSISPQLRRAMEAQTLGVIMTQLQRMQASPWITVDSETLEGVEAQGAWNPASYNVPALTVMFAFFLVGTVAQSIWLEKEQGSFRRLLAAPIQRWAIIAGKIAAYMLVVCAQVLVLFTIGSAVFDMPLGDSPLGLALLTLALALTSTALGMLIAALSRTSRQADTLGMVLPFVLAGIGGSIYPMYQMEGFIGFLSRLTPHAHALIGFTGLMVEGAGWVDILPQVGVVTAMGAVFFLIAVWRFRFE